MNGLRTVNLYVSLRYWSVYRASTDEDQPSLVEELCNTLTTVNASKYASYL